MECPVCKLALPRPKIDIFDPESARRRSHYARVQDGPVTRIQVTHENGMACIIDRSVYDALVAETRAEERRGRERSGPSIGSTLLAGMMGLGAAVHGDGANRERELIVAYIRARPKDSAESLADGIQLGRHRLESGKTP